MTRREFLKDLGIYATVAYIPTSLHADNTKNNAKFSDIKQDFYAKVKDMMMKYAYEHNTVEVRKNVETDVADMFYDYMIEHNIPVYENYFICDETNNTIEAIDKNELHLTIGIKEDNCPNFIKIDFKTYLKDN